MTATPEELEQRVLALEAEVRALRTRLESPPADETPAQRGERLVREAKASQAAISAGLPELLAAFGIPPDFQPMSIEDLHKQMIAEGVNPEDCGLSREIIRMREERANAILPDRR